METNVKSNGRNIPIDVIKQSVSQASRISIDDMNLSNKDPLSRKREKVAARQISMTLCKSYTKASLATIGFHHGGHDHATVLHASKTINNLIDTKDPLVLDWFTQSDKLIKDWCRKNPIKAENILTSQQKINLIKHWIRNRVPLFVRERELMSIGKICPVCGHSLLTTDKYGNTIKTLSNSLQRSYKK